MLKNGFLRYKIDNKYQKAKIKNLEKRLDFQKYNIKEKKKKRKKKTQELLKKQQPQRYIYGVCFKNRVFFSLKSNRRL